MSQSYSGHLRNAVISHNTNGDNEIIAAPSDGYIVIDHINLVNTSAVSVKFKSGDTDLSGAYPLAEKQPITLENAYHSDQGVLTCGRGEAFKINLSSGVLISGFVRYRVIGS
jgi:hypothetical protein